VRAEFWAVLTAICWGCGSYFEKKGVKLGGFSPIMGTTIRTVTSLLLLTFLSYPFWHQVRTAGIKPILMIAIAGGVFAGALGIVFLYNALKLGNLSTVLPIAFCLTPVLGVLLGALLLREKLAFIQYVGIALTIVGAAITAYFA
jgi:uncharacterized membrane protein